MLGAGVLINMLPACLCDCDINDVFRLCQVQCIMLEELDSMDFLKLHLRSLWPLTQSIMIIIKLLITEIIIFNITESIMKQI